MAQTVYASAGLLDYNISHQLDDMLAHLYGLAAIAQVPNAEQTGAASILIPPYYVHHPTGRAALEKSANRWGQVLKDLVTYRAHAKLGARTKYMLIWADMLKQHGVLSTELEDLLWELHHYTWQTPVYKGAKLYAGRNKRLLGKPVVFREIGPNTDRGAWWYPAKIRTVTKRWKNKSGEHSRTTVHVTPPWDMKPGLLAGHVRRAIPIPLSQEFLNMARYDMDVAVYMQRRGIDLEGPKIT